MSAEIFLHNGGVAYVGVDYGPELLFTNPGVYHLSGVLYVSGGTNGWAGVTNAAPGTVVAVDNGGRVNVTGGPDLAYIGITGFATAVLIVGTLLLIRTFGRWIVAALSENFSRTVD